MRAILMNPTVHAGILAWLGAAAADIQVFKGYHTWAEWRHFSWSTATVRWFWGILAGVTAGTAYGTFFA